jgi:cytochrome c oxidase subunit 4
MSTHEEHHSSPSYLSILSILLFLTVVTVAVAYVDMGSFNIVVAMFVASIKALLVATYFMHLKFEDTITRFFAIVPIILLAIMIAGVFIDNPLRVDPRAPELIAQEKIKKHKELEELKAMEHGDGGHH